MILSTLLAKVPVNGWMSCPITAWAYELDHISGGTGRVAFSRPGHGLPVRPLHTRSGNAGQRRRARSPRADLLEPFDARQAGIETAAQEHTVPPHYHPAPPPPLTRSHSITPSPHTP